jgi:hypothetical protein
MLPVFRRFNKGDLPAAPNWIENIFNPLNVFCETVTTTLTKNLTIGENVQGQKFTVTFTTLPTYTTGDFTPIRYNYTGGGQPNCLMIGNISRTDGTLMLLPPAVTGWSMNINKNPFLITINYIAGLDNSTQYNITLVAI